MVAITKNRIVLLIVVSLILLPSGQLFAQELAPGCAVEVPQWVRDRQQYETTYVWEPPAAELVDAAGIFDDIPQWVIDRQQYETTFVYVPPATQVQTAAAESEIPQWVKDRQQYETTYHYVPPVESLALAYSECAAVQAGDF
jgi:hypothetical protein